MKSFLCSLVFATAFIACAGASSPVGSLAVPAQVETFTVEGAGEARVGDRVVLSPINFDGAKVSWLPIDGDELIGKMVMTEIPREIVNDDLEFELLPVSSLLFKPIKAGKIRFICTCYGPDVFSQVIHSVTVKGGDQDSSDDTTPSPEPDNGDDVVKSYDEIWLVLIEESANREESNKIINSVKLDEFCKSNKIQKSEYDKDDPNIPRGYLTLANGEGLPSFILSGVRDGKSEMIKKGKFPATVDELIKSIESYKVK